jgi:hypothetical protein
MVMAKISKTDRCFICGCKNPTRPVLLAGLVAGGDLPENVFVCIACADDDSNDSFVVRLIGALGCGEESEH